MSEELRLVATDAIKPCPHSLRLMAHPLEFAACPLDDIGVDPDEGRTQLRLIEVAVVGDPTTDVRIAHRRQILQGFVTAPLQGPSSDRPANRFERFRARSRLEAVREDTLLTFPPHRLPCSKLKAEKVECDDGKVARPIHILAVDDLRLLRMQFQLAIGKTIAKRTPESLGLRLGSAVTYDIVGVAFERYVRIVPRHPRIKRIVQKQVCQERTDNAALWCA